MSDSLLEQSIIAMRERFQNLEYSGALSQSGSLAVWRGNLVPIRRVDGLYELIADLIQNAPVTVDDGEVRSLESRQTPIIDELAKHPELLERLPHRSFEVEIYMMAFAHLAVG